MIEFFHNYGLFGLFLAAFLSGSVFPFNSESVLTLLILSGFSAVSCLIVASIGNMLGGISIYYLGYLGNIHWIEKYAKIKEEKIQAILPKLNKYGPPIASLSFVPFLGDVVILALGFFKISPVFTTFFMLLGKTARYAFVIWVMRLVM